MDFRNIFMCSNFVWVSHNEPAPQKKKQGSFEIAEEKCWPISGDVLDLEKQYLCSGCKLV